MTTGRFIILTCGVCLIFFVGLYAVIQGERSAVRDYSVNIDDVLKSGRESKSLTIFSKDGVKLYERVTEETAPLPNDIPPDLYYMVKFAGENLFECDRPSTQSDLDLLKFHSIPLTGLDNCIVLHTAEKAVGHKQHGLKSRILLWKTAADLVKRYKVRGVLRAYMANTYMQNDIWGIEAASRRYFGKSVSYADTAQKAWLVSVLTLGHMPSDDCPEFTKRKDMLIYRLYRAGLIDYGQYAAQSGRELTYSLHREINLMPEYTSIVLDELREKGIRTDRRLTVHTSISVQTLEAAQEAIAEKIEKYPKGINIAMAIVNYETGGVEALAANDRWRWRTMDMRRQIGSTFKPIVYLTAVTQGAQPNEIIVDKRYRYNLGNYVYSPENFDDYYMGSIPMRLGLVYSLNNATIRLAKLTGLRKVSRMAVNLGMKARIKPYLAMPLGIFPITPLNLAKVYSSFGTYGVKKDIGFINSIKDGQGDNVYLKKKLPVRVAPERHTYQVLYMMKDVVRRGTARGSGLLWGTAAKTGTTDDYKDAWTVAIFPPYAVVCWVGFDDHRSMGEKGTGGGRAAPVIAAFQKIIMKNTKKIDFNVPEGIVFRHVDFRTGMVTGKDCGARRSYMEAFLKEDVPASCSRRKVAFTYGKIAKFQ